MAIIEIAAGAAAGVEEGLTENDLGRGFSDGNGSGAVVVEGVSLGAMDVPVLTVSIAETCHECEHGALLIVVVVVVAAWWWGGGGNGMGSACVRLPNVVGVVQVVPWASGLLACARVANSSLVVSVRVHIVLRGHGHCA